MSDEHIFRIFELHKGEMDRLTYRNESLYLWFALIYYCTKVNSGEIRCQLSR